MAQGAGDDGTRRSRSASLAALFTRRRARVARAEPETASPSAPPSPPPPDPLTIRQWLWGPGYVIPGGPPQVLALVKPFGLTSAMTMLDMAAGLGGPARTVAEAFNTYVAGLERDPLLARLGMEMSITQGLGKRASVSLADPESYELKGNHYDCVLGREALHGVRDKERLLRVLIQGLKPRGGFVLTEFLRDRAAGDRAELAQWEAQQFPPPLLWSLDQHVDCLKSLGLDVRVTEDISQAYCDIIATAWGAFLDKTDLRTLPRSHAEAVFGEAERSLATVRALDSGALRMYRIYAIAGRGRTTI